MKKETEPILRGIYCTVVAQNYLPQALALYSSIRKHEPDREIVILVVDADRKELELNRPRLRVADTSFLGLTSREIEDLAAIYDVVEFSTAVKPLFFKKLLIEFEHVVYLDPDTFLVSPLLELEGLLENHGVVLTPHFLEPIGPGNPYITEVHSLTVGVHNLGFCAFSRVGIDFLDWWWSHLERECLIYPLFGIFVDQKWTDVGATLFKAFSLRHYGYNAGPWNLHERGFERTNGVLTMTGSGEPLRLFHFSGFDANDPDAISERLNVSLKGSGLGGEELRLLGHQYARQILDSREILGKSPAYHFEVDSSGKRLDKRTRRAFRKDLVSNSSSPGIPSAFDPDQAQSFREWRRKSWRSKVHMIAGDAAIALKYVFPEEFTSARKSFPTQFRWVRARLLRASRVRR